MDPAVLRVWASFGVSIQEFVGSSSWIISYYRVELTFALLSFFISIFFNMKVNQGFVAVMQDFRGRYTSGGNFQCWFNATSDGADTIRWRNVILRHVYGLRSFNIAGKDRSILFHLLLLSLCLCMEPHQHFDFIFHGFYFTFQ